jgi:hypothetical protein
MTNHFHLVVETPQPNLALGMKWFLGTYTQRFNWRHQHWGHLFGGRYKAQPIDGRSPGYFRCACDYVHLNPVRAGIIASEEQLRSFLWSSYPAYLRPQIRPLWLRVERLLGEHGLTGDTAKNRREFERAMEAIRLAPFDVVQFRRGWRIGADDFCNWLVDKLGRPGRQGEQAKERFETDEALAERIVIEALNAAGWREIDLAATAKGHQVKVGIAKQLRSQTPMSRQWIANRLSMGSAGYVSNLLNSIDI